MLCTAEYFANELNRLRPLTDSELNKLQAVLCGRTPVRRIWTAAEDRELMRLRKTSPHRYAREYASKTGRTEWSVRSRVRNLERRMQRDG